MAKYLVIVESPAKVKTIKKFLGKNYEVMASNGHVRDLPKSSLGIDVDGDFEPKYITIRGKGEILAKLRKEAKKADKIYLATDHEECCQGIIKASKKNRYGSCGRTAGQTSFGSYSRLQNQSAALGQG